MRSSADASSAQIAPALASLLVESVTDYAIFALDAAGRVLSWNRGAEGLLGYAPHEVIGRPFSIFHTSDDAQAGVPGGELAGARETGRFEAEGWRVRKDGSRFWANAIVTALRDADGALVGFAKITRDLTARRDAEERERRIAAEQGAREEAERRAEELAHLTEQLRSQAVELEAQTEEAQALAEELEQTNEELQEALAAADGERDRATEQEHFIRGILESIAEPFVVIGGDWKVRFLNAAAARYLREIGGGVPADAIGRDFWTVYAVVQGTSFGDVIREAFERRTPASVEAYSPGRGEWWVVSAYPLADGGVVTQWRDVSTRRRVEETQRYLARSGEILGASLDYETTLGELARLVVPELGDWCGVHVVDETGVPQQVAVAHVDSEKVRLARELGERYPSRPDDPTGVPNVLRTGQPELYPEIPDALLVAGARDAEHLRISRALGLRSAMIVPLLARGRVLGTLTLVAAESARRYSQADLTLVGELAHRAALAVDNARLHREAQDARRAAEAANQAKSQFLAVMSHELRTPLNAIGGYAELLSMGLRGPVTDEQQDDLARITRNQRALLALINDILNFARLESGHVEFAAERVMVRELVADLESMVLPQLTAKSIAFAVDECDPALGVHADREKVRQVLLNLLSNAIKFTPEGGRVGIGWAADDDAVRIAVRDTGIGVPGDKQQSIFEPFVQLDRTLSRSHEGSGLGLAISRDLARGMGGELTVASAPGEGSTFTLSLPRAERTAH